MSSNVPTMTSSSSMSMGSSSSSGSSIGSTTHRSQLNVPRSPRERNDDDDDEEEVVVVEDSDGSAAMILKDAETAAPTSQHHQQQVQPPPVSTNNVGELVTKAKKAAASLWMILHAQNCRLPNCPHRGCTETKPLLLHVKICIAGPNFPCPTNYKGCNEARKLLAHYRKCKDARSRQQASGLVGRQLFRPSDQGSCLVCSLMARYAKTMMERTAAINHNNNSSQSKNDSILSSSLDGKVNTNENGLANFATHPPHHHPKRTPSMTLMPPPPPRRLTTHVSIPMLWPSSSSSLSLSSSFSANRMLGSMAMEDDGSLIVPFPTANNSNNNLRQRAVSYDERQSVEFDSVPPPSIRRCYLDAQRNVEELEYEVTIPSSPSRPRSASCSNLSMGYNTNNTMIRRPLSSHHECGTIAED